MKIGYILPKIICTINEYLGNLTVYRPGHAKDVLYENKIYYSSDKKLYLNACYPAVRKEGAPLPVFVYIHGGGWISGKPEFRKGFVSRIASAGFFTINIFYGLAPKYCNPFAVQNIYKALGWLVENKDKYNLDLDRLYVGGESAGAHLSATLGAISVNEDYKAAFGLCETSKDLRFKALILNCGIYDMNTALKTSFPFMKSYISAYYGKPFKYFDTDPGAEYLSPLKFVNKDFPKSFIITAAHDPLTVGGRELAARLKELEVPYVHHHGTGLFAVHAYPVAQALKETKAVMPKITAFIKEDAGISN